MVTLATSFVATWPVISAISLTAAAIQPKGVQVERQKRIAGGLAISRTDAPFMAKVAVCPSGKGGGLDGVFCTTICSGTVVFTRWVLTAAQCATKPNTTEPLDHLYVIIGDYRGLSLDKDVRTIRVSRIQLYPMYQPSRTYLHNLGLLMLEERLTLNDQIQAIALPPNRDYNELMYRGDFVMAYGYGSATDSDSEVGSTNSLRQILGLQKTVILRSVRMPVVDTIFCNHLFNASISNRTEALTQLCYGGEPQKGICLRDEGGPVVWIRGRDGFRMVIAVNTDKWECSSGLPHLGTKIAGDHLSWIKRFIYT